MPRRLPDYRAFSLRHPAWLKRLRQGLVYGIMRSLQALAVRLSLPRGQALGRMLGRIAYRFSPRERRLCRMQLALALPALPEAERTRIARQCLESQGMTLMELLALPRLRREGAPWLRLEGEAALLAAHARGRGVVLLTAHVSNWELIVIAVERLRIRATAVVSTLANPRLNRIVGEIRRFEWMDIAERGSQSSPRQLLGALKRGDLLVLANDVDIQTQGVFVDFFGLPAHTPRAPAALALRLDAPVLTYFDLRQPDGSHVIRFEEVPLDEAIRSAADPVHALTQAISDRIEAHIRAHPGQWAWNHRRWRTRPPESAGA
jgi:Kdo2-lipid IVA lauroyltransferase/acyltransferase